MQKRWTISSLKQKPLFINWRPSHLLTFICRDSLEQNNECTRTQAARAQPRTCEGPADSQRDSRYRGQIYRQLPGARPVEGSLPSLPSNTARLQHTSVFYDTSCRTLCWQARESRYKMFPALRLADGRTGNYTAKTQPTQPRASRCVSTAPGALGRTEAARRPRYQRRSPPGTFKTAGTA